MLGDGAHWIWKLSPKLFGNTAECLDIFHASEHISGCGDVLFQAAEQQRCWFEDTRMLLRKGFVGVNEELERLLKVIFLTAVSRSWFVHCRRIFITIGRG
ncbi:hypothetical protein FACS1894170_12490 [Planctomycetales bacterium]|nr:hypothetical protein FACS1894170_12490 [Planctomycetales bacterium]